MAYICISKKNLLPGEELKISKNQACSWVYNVNRKWKSLTRKRGMSLPIGKKAIQMQSGKIFWRSIKSCGLSKAPRRKHWIGGVYPPKNYYKQCLGLIFIFLSFNNVVIKMHENMIESYINIFFQWQVLNYDCRLAPSHPEPLEPNTRKLQVLRSSLYFAILHSEDHFQMPWAMNVLRLKIDKEMKAHNFDKSDGVCGVIHVLHLKSRTATALKVGCSSYPSLSIGMVHWEDTKPSLLQWLWKRLRQFICIRAQKEHIR